MSHQTPQPVDPAEDERNIVVELSLRLDDVQAQLSELHTDGEDPTELVYRANLICENADFAVLGFGLRRVGVVLTARRVAKLAWRRAGLGDNELEWRLWQAADETLRRLLAPMHWRTAGGVGVQGRCLPISADALSSPGELTRELAQAGITDALLNLGIYEGRAVCYDYATVRADRALELLLPADQQLSDLRL